MKNAVGVILCNPAYEDAFKDANDELYEEMKGKSLDLFNKSGADKEHEVS